jgi:hypothetical protein
VSSGEANIFALVIGSPVQENTGFTSLQELLVVPPPEPTQLHVQVVAPLTLLPLVPEAQL